MRYAFHNVTCSFLRSEVGGCGVVSLRQGRDRSSRQSDCEEACPGGRKLKPHSYPKRVEEGVIAAMKEFRGPHLLSASPRSTESTFPPLARMQYPFVTSTAPADILTIIYRVDCVVSYKDALGGVYVGRGARRDDGFACPNISVCQTSLLASVSNDLSVCLSACARLIQ